MIESLADQLIGQTLTRGMNLYDTPKVESQGKKITGNSIRNFPLFGSNVEIRLHLRPKKDANRGIAAVEPASSKCPPDTCIESFESQHK